MGKKITWDQIYKDFKSRYRNLRKEVIGFRPHDYLAIVLYLKSGRKVTYSYETKDCRFLEE